MADPDLELRGGGGGFFFVCLLAFLPSVLSSFFTKNKGSGVSPLDPPLLIYIYPTYHYIGHGSVTHW